jgi:tight adherence protein B
MTRSAPAVLAALLVVAAVLAVPRAGAAARLRLRRLTPRVEPMTGSARPADVTGLAEHLAGAFRAGLTPSRAWAALAAQPGPWSGVADAVLPWLEIGMPAGRALSEAARPAPGSPLVPLVVALDVSDRTGAATADVLDGMATALRAQEAAAHESAVALAAPRATVRVMTALPAAGLAMAGLLGADVLHVLIATTAGHACVAAGMAFWGAGQWWTGRLVRAAGRADG